MTRSTTSLYLFTELSLTLFYTLFLYKLLTSVVILIVLPLDIGKDTLMLPTSLIDTEHPWLTNFNRYRHLEFILVILVGTFN